MNCDLFNFSGQGSGDNILEKLRFYTKSQIALSLKMQPIALEAPFCYILKSMNISLCRRFPSADFWSNRQF